MKDLLNHTPPDIAKGMTRRGFLQVMALAPFAAPGMDQAATILSKVGELSTIFANPTTKEKPRVMGKAFDVLRHPLAERQKLQQMQIAPIFLSGSAQASGYILVGQLHDTRETQAFYDIQTAILNGAGEAITDLVSTSGADTGTQIRHHPAVAVDDRGKALVVWQQRQSLERGNFINAIQGAFVNVQTGERQDEPFVISQSEPDSQLPTAVWDARTRRYIVAWNRVSNHGNDSQIVGTTFAPENGNIQQTPIRLLVIEPGNQTGAKLFTHPQSGDIYLAYLKNPRRTPNTYELVMGRIYCPPNQSVRLTDRQSLVRPDGESNFQGIVNYDVKIQESSIWWAATGFGSQAFVGLAGQTDIRNGNQGGSTRSLTFSEADIQTVGVMRSNGETLIAYSKRGTFEERTRGDIERIRLAGVNMEQRLVNFDRPATDEGGMLTETHILPGERPLVMWVNHGTAGSSPTSVRAATLEL